jgi:hypothetical protein
MGQGTVEKMNLEAKERPKIVNSAIIKLWNSETHIPLKNQIHNNNKAKLFKKGSIIRKFIIHEPVPGCMRQRRSKTAAAQKQN